MPHSFPQLLNHVLVLIALFPSFFLVSFVFFIAFAMESCLILSFPTEFEMNSTWRCNPYFFFISICPLLFLSLRLTEHCMRIEWSCAFWLKRFLSRFKIKILDLFPLTSFYWVKLLLLLTMLLLTIYTRFFLCQRCNVYNLFKRKFILWFVSSGFFLVPLLWKESFLFSSVPLSERVSLSLTDL